MSSVLLPVLAAAALLTGTLIYGHLRMADNPTKPGPTIALIQGSIDVEMQYDPTRRDRIFKQYFALSKEVAEKNKDIDLIVWPESMFVEPLFSCDTDAVRPAEFEGSDADFRARIGDFMRQVAERKSTMAWTAQMLHSPMLLGGDAVHYSADGMQLTNSVLYVAADGRYLGRYDKMHLVMFGEYVPFARRFPWLQHLTPLPTSALPGIKPVAFDVKGFRIAPNICYESVLSRVVRHQVAELIAEGREPDILVNVTNDGWFWGSSELDMHLACGVFRAVECRKPFLIAANTGFSAWINSDGRIIAQGPRRAPGTILATPVIDTARHSWYLAHGDWFAGACLAVCFGLAALGISRRKRQCIDRDG